MNFVLASINLAYLTLCYSTLFEYTAPLPEELRPQGVQLVRVQPRLMPWLNSEITVVRKILISMIPPIHGISKQSWRWFMRLTMSRVTTRIRVPVSRSSPLLPHRCFQEPYYATDSYRLAVTWASREYDSPSMYPGSTRANLTDHLIAHLVGLLAGRSLLLCIVLGNSYHTQ
jgi:hypothetical protein